MTDPVTLAVSLDYMERKGLRRTSRGRRIPYGYMWRLRELNLTEHDDSSRCDALTDLGRQVLTELGNGQ